MAREADGVGRRLYAVAWWVSLGVGLVGVATEMAYTPGGLRGGYPPRDPSVFEAHGMWLGLLWPALVTGRWVGTGRWGLGPRF